MTLPKQQRILIWGKTYPELSAKYFETVCTGGVLEDGTPIRLYPVPYRYLDERFRKYQWINAMVMPNQGDPRPESYKIVADSIEIGDVIPPTNDEWGKRADIIFKKKEWLFDSVDALLEAQEKNKTSLGVVKPKKILDVSVVQRSEDEELSFDEKLERLRVQHEISRSQIDLFSQSVPPEMKHLDFIKRRVKVRWECHSTNCKSHSMQILDWEVAELHRRLGDDKALQAVQERCDLNEFALKFFLGNISTHPTAFTIVGLWYPKRKSLLF